MQKTILPQNILFRSQSDIFLQLSCPIAMFVNSLRLPSIILRGSPSPCCFICTRKYWNDTVLFNLKGKAKVFVRNHQLLQPAMLRVFKQRRYFFLYQLPTRGIDRCHGAHKSEKCFFSRFDPHMETNQVDP